LLEEHTVRRLVADAAQVPAADERVAVGRCRRQRIARRAVELQPELQALMMIAPVLDVRAEVILEHAIADADRHGLKIEPRPFVRLADRGLAGERGGEETGDETPHENIDDAGHELPPSGFIELKMPRTRVVLPCAR
jgi:hypothetical protein